ncbi:MAG: carbohydrate ABC transporter permease [Chloroflexota bacterium]|nr:MAG: ABC transporter permease [Chloroflexota bacterium]
MNGKQQYWRYIPLTLWALFVAFPLYWVAVTAFKDNGSIYSGARWLPWVDFKPTLSAWHDILGGSNSVYAPIVHSLIIATVSTLIALFFGALAGYGLARFPMRFTFMRNNDIAFWIVSQRIMPPVVVVLAFFIVYKNLQLLDTLLGMIIAYTGFSLPLTTWFMTSYFKQLPKDLEEAAYIDGAGRLQTFLRVALPLVTPGLIATFLLAFSFAWNEFLFAVVLTSTNATTLPLVIAVQQGQLGTSWWNICAISLVSIVPMVFFAIILQRRLVTGLLGGAVK